MNDKDFEEYLVDMHDCNCFDDDMPDCHDQWLADLDCDMYIKYANQYAEYVKNPHKLTEGVKILAFLYKAGEPIDDSSLETLTIKKGDILGHSEVNNLTYIYREGKEYEFYGLANK